jgi:hypothetical protein
MIYLPDLNQRSHDARRRRCSLHLSANPTMLRRVLSAIVAGFGAPAVATFMPKVPYRVVIRKGRLSRKSNTQKIANMGWKTTSATVKVHRCNQ